jgi:beta-glucanase (GH16 family)
LRIRADAKKNSSGIISSENNAGTGFKVSAPCYFECRFIAPNAKGTWPAFWLLTDNIPDIAAGKSDASQAVDELDIIEAVGGEGAGEPNATGEDKNSGLYQITPHAWNQGDAGNAAAGQAYKDIVNPADMRRIGIPSTWFSTFHTYGIRITDTDTIYYCDNIEMGRHKTLANSKKSPFFFLINLATGGGWPVDLSRYDGKADMYVDFVRVYGQAQPAKP